MEEPSVEVSSSSSARRPSQEEQDGVSLRRIPVGVLLRALLGMLMMVGLVAGIHGYLGLRLLVDPQLPLPWQQPVVSGLATVSGVRVYTNRGTGYWGPPFRLGPTPEITELTLVSA